ncbi:uncharacterized protein MONBRDRAFT_26008 [Monosiga brevicollis MX1]|uniref:SAM domain-containing protein n=1 Tax=Monosiga brevicollis TaxID=81824 RepID=A9V138_MONBE|nr:uncharacterized protein MONBRDRAFT_26008 [Monosiga brevicollis MX1]EDQ88740.1 predicted protein [Monosiga brevicollis MX1]|eukprot:XP_001746353.1 hypothetical protein [Monosiga brevicollis MX1]
MQAEMKRSIEAVKQSLRPSAPYCVLCDEAIFHTAVSAQGLGLLHPACFRCAQCDDELDGKPYHVRSGEALCTTCFKNRATPGLDCDTDQEAFRCDECNLPILDEEDFLYVKGHIRHRDCCRCSICSCLLTEGSKAVECNGRLACLAHDRLSTYSLDEQGITLDVEQPVLRRHHRAISPMYESAEEAYRRKSYRISRDETIFENIFLSEDEDEEETDDFAEYSAVSMLRRELTPPPLPMGRAPIREWLAALELEHYTINFVENEFLSWQALWDVSDQDLKSIGITSSEDRDRICNALRPLSLASRLSQSRKPSVKRSSIKRRESRLTPDEDVSIRIKHLELRAKLAEQRAEAAEQRAQAAEARLQMTAVTAHS